jgi:hypothetical protein
MTEELIERLADAGYVNATPAVHAVFENINPSGAYHCSCGTRRDGAPINE